MRYFRILSLLGVSIVLTIAACGGGSGTPPGDSGSEATGTLSAGSAAGGAGRGGGNGSGGNIFVGPGGSSGVGVVIPDGGPDSGPTTCAGAITCKGQGLDCGETGDGCGGILMCGDTCPAGMICGGGGKANVCAKPPCSALTCTALGFTCGMQGDGCGSTLDCGTCTAPESCGGGGTANACGQSDAGPCVPATCTSLGATCGTQGDGCGMTLDCGTCAAGQTCGGGGTTNACGAPACVAKTCNDLMATCGMQGDGCGGQIDCGTCTVMGENCGGGGVPNQCGDPTKACPGLCQQQVVCTSPATTSVSGIVYAPNGTDPLVNVLVYVPNSPVLPFTPGVSCDTCDGTTSIVSGSPLVSTTTGVDGSFTLPNMPVGTNIPLVIQNGRWRRQVVVPTVTSCVDTPVPAALTRFPRTKAEGDIPLMGFVTGAVDALECVLRKIGIADTEFSDPTGTGRVRFYQGNGTGNNAGPGARISATTPSENQLWGTQAAINAYDMVYFACQGGQFNKTAASQQAVINYANAGGRVFTTHYSYVWLDNDAPFSTTATWAPDPNNNNKFAADPGVGVINQTFLRGQQLAQWLQLLYPTSTLGQIQIDTLRHDFTAVAPTSLLWISLTDKTAGTVPMHYTFDTPVAVPAAQQCGRVLYDDFHVENALNAATKNKTFPTECVVNTMSPQEKMLEFMLFDLGAFICPPKPPMCIPQTCEGLKINCGPAGDGCGGLLQCGNCPSGQTCGGGGVPGQCDSPPCTPLDCPSQGLMCGLAGDGCGNQIKCGDCPSGQTCGGGGKAGVCGSMACTPQACPANIECGPAGDGCGNLQQCGDCPPDQTCGGGGTPGKCGKPVCTPVTCADLHFNCGPANDGCNNILECGSCTSPQTCGGGGTAGVCGGGVSG
jgi:hypothetical protein